MPKIHTLIEQGKIEKVRKLLEANPELVGEKLRTSDPDLPLHIAAWQNQSEAATLLLNKGAAVDAIGDRGWTPLHYAAHHGSAEVARILIESGASLNIEDENGWTPIVHAIYGREPSCLDISALIEEAGALLDLNCYAGLGRTEDICRLIERAEGENIPTRNRYVIFDDLVIALTGSGNTAQVIDDFRRAMICLKSAGFNLNDMGTYGTPALFNGVQSGSVEIVRLLLEQGADVNIRVSLYGQTYDVMSYNLNDEDGAIQKLLLDFGYERLKA